MCGPSAHSDGKVIVWLTATMEPHLTLEGHVGAVLSCSVNAEDTCIVSSGESCAKYHMAMKGLCSEDITVQLYSASQVCFPFDVPEGNQGLTPYSFLL